jgi:hypothetical protein
LLNCTVENYVRARSPSVFLDKYPPVDAAKVKLADLQVDQVVIDWVIFSPLCSSAPSARSAEKTKMTKYSGDDVLRAVVPCAFSVFGGLTPTTLRVLRHIEQLVDGEKNSLVSACSRSIASMTAGMIRAARVRQALSERPKPASGLPITTTTMRLDQLAPLAAEDQKMVFEDGLFDEVAFSTLASLVLATPQSKTVATSLAAGLSNSSSSLGEGEGDEGGEGVGEANKEVTRPEQTFDEEKAVVVENENLPSLASLPADSPFLFVPVIPQNSLLESVTEIDEVDREMEIPSSVTC